MSDAAIHEQIDRLSPVDVYRLRSFGKYLVLGLGDRAKGRDGDDLFQIAVTRTLTGERSWNRQVTLIEHLLGAMRSIANSWHNERNLETALSAGVLTSASTELDAHQEAAAKQQLTALRDFFAGNERASRALELLIEGFTWADIRRCMGLSGAQYKQLTRYFRRTLERAFPDLALNRAGPSHDLSRSLPFIPGSSGTRPV